MKSSINSTEFKISNLLFAGLLCLPSPNTFAVLIDFEGLSLGTEVNTQFQALVVTFSSPGGTVGMVIGNAQSSTFELGRVYS